MPSKTRSSKTKTLNRKIVTKKKKGNKAVQVLQRLGRKRGVLFVLVFAVLGTGLLLYARAAEVRINVACPTDAGVSYGAWGVWRGNHAHAGIDIDVSYRPIYAAESGQVIFAGEDDQLHWGYQQTIDLRGTSGYTYRYAHLSKIEVSSGQGVQAGQRIGVSGGGEGTLDSRRVSPHLHWEIRTDGGRDGKIEGTVDPSWAYEHCGGGAPAAAAPTTGGGGGVNPSGTDCHTYVLQYDPNNYYPCVRHLQTDLGIPADGYYGPQTVSAVKNVQAQNGLPQSGTVDAATWCVIHRDLAGCAQSTPPPSPSESGVQGRIFRDDNGNGAKDDAEPLIGTCGGGLNVDASVTANGETRNADTCYLGPLYKISTPAGQQSVRVNPPPGWSSTNGNTRTATVNSGRFTDVGPWFGIRPTPTSPPPVATTSSGSGSRISNEWNGLCLDVPGYSQNNGTLMHLWGCHGDSNQRWTYTNGTLKVYGNKCLDVTAGRFSRGTHIQIYDCIPGNPNQQWVRGADRTIRPKSATSLCLDASGWGRDNGTPVIIWTCGGQQNQRWYW